MASNLYIHFPFCRTKCSYCNLYSRAGINASERESYVHEIIQSVNRLIGKSVNLKTIYFGGGSPALCDLRPILSILHSPEFTVELHPLDVNEELLSMLKAGGVNRISMGVQSMNDEVLKVMGRGYTVEVAHRAFDLVKRYFENVGIDLIVGYPGDERVEIPDWGFTHCSVYALQNERKLKGAAEDEVVMDRLKVAEGRLKELGLKRYEISNYAREGYECQHNLAVWRGEDYLGIGEGACGRVGLKRTRGVRRNGEIEYAEELVGEDFDRKERAFFRLRTREGFDAGGFPELVPTLERFVSEGLLQNKAGSAVYQLTERGTEVCDSILAELL